MRVLNILASGNAGGIESLCNNIDKYSDIDNYWVFLFDGGKNTEQMKKRHPDKVVILGYNKIKVWKYIRRITEICKKEEIDIINIHHGGTYCNLIYTKLKKKNPNVLFIRTLHSCYEDKYNLNGNIIRDKLNLFYLNKALQISNLIVCVSDAVKETYEKKFSLSNKKIVVIYNGIDKKFFENSNKVTKNGDFNKIIYIGRLEKEKGINILLEAFSKLYKKYDLKLTIVGDGREKDKLIMKTKELGIDNNTSFLGTRMDIIDLLDEENVFVYPSICEEAFGISVVEAMARKCIPVTFYKGGLKEIILDGTNGFFAKEESVEGLCEAIENSLLCKNKNELIANALETAKKFSIDNTIIKLKEEYTKIK